jgi:hypothetical protein
MLAVAVADQLAAVGGHNFNEAQDTWQRNSNIPTSHPNPVVFLSKTWLTF